MDINGLSANGLVNMAVSQQQGALQEQVGVSMLKKAIDMQSQGVLSLINTLPQPGKGLPMNVGNNINTTA